ncbi:MAG: alanine dehydrogenase [Cyanobacteriota bacterium ELA615]
MKIGVPKEIKDQEFRVGLSPDSVKVLIGHGHQIYIESGAGTGSSFSDSDYQASGAIILDNAPEIWQQDMVVKVKEPLTAEYPYLKAGGLLFTYLHLAANRELTSKLIESGITAYAYESVELADGRLPLLTPMSIIAGRLAVQFGARYLEKQQGGRGVLLSGIPGVASGQVVILGAGVVGTESARIALGMGARVTVLDINPERLSYLENIFGSQIELILSNSAQIEAIVPQSDLLIGAVLLPNRKAPTLVSRDLVKQMKDGSVIVDVAIDQGGCVETLRATSHSAPTYIEEGVVHYGVPNMPGAVPWTATQALNNSTLPYVLKLAQNNTEDSSLIKGLNVRDHQLIHTVLKEIFIDLA